jgi:type IV secretion system protein VirD4
MKNIDLKKLIIKTLPFVIFFYLFGKAGQAFRLAQGVDLSGKLLNINGGFAAAFQNPLPSFHVQDMLVGVVGAAIIALALQIKRSNQKKYRKGVEYGSARWGAYYLLKELLYGRKRRKRHDRIQQDHRAILPSFSR